MKAARATRTAGAVVCLVGFVLGGLLKVESARGGSNPNMEAAFWVSFGVGVGLVAIGRAMGRPGGESSDEHAGRSSPE